MSLRRADHSSRGIPPTVVRRCVLSRNLKNEEAMARAGPQRHRGGKKSNSIPKNNWIFITRVRVIKKFMKINHILIYSDGASCHEIALFVPSTTDTYHARISIHTLPKWTKCFWKQAPPVRASSFPTLLFIRFFESREQFWEFGLTSRITCSTHVRGLTISYSWKFLFSNVNSQLDARTIILLMISISSTRMVTSRHHRLCIIPQAINTV